MTNGNFSGDKIYPNLDAIVIELVVRAQGGQRPCSDRVCKEYLSGGVYPALRGVQLGPVRGDVQQQALARALQGDRLKQSPFAF